MRIKLLRPDLENDYIFQIKNQKEIYLTSIDYNDKKTCLVQLQTVLLDLRDNEQIAIQSGNNNQYYFEVTGLAQSPSFEEIEAASDVLFQLKEFTHSSHDFAVSYKKPSKKVVSKQKIGVRAEGYNFDTVSSTNQPGFELIDNKGSRDKYFHFNDANGKAILYSRVYDGKTRRLKAINVIIKQATDSKHVEVVKQDGQFFFIFKTPEGYEIARSKRFKNRENMAAAMAYLATEAANYIADFKLPKKKKKKRKANKKYHLKQASPQGLIGFEGFKSKKNKLHYFHYNDKKKQILLFSKPFNKRSQRDEHIAEVLKIGTSKKAYKTWKKSKNQYYFSILDPKEKSFARSRYFSTEKKMLAALKTFREQLATYPIAVNEIVVSKKKKYTVTLPEKSIPVVAKGLIVAAEEEVVTPVMPEVVPIEKPDVLSDILPQPIIRIEREIVEVETEEIVEITEIEEEIVETEEIVNSYTSPIAAVIEEKEEVRPAPIISTIEKDNQPIQQRIIDKKASSRFPWWWLLLGLLAFALLLLGLKQCNTAEPTIAPKPTPKVVETPRPKPVEPAKLGPTAFDLNLTPNTAEARIADFLSTPKLVVPRIFVLESVQFPFNSAALTTTSPAQLDNVVRVMQEYPKTKIEVNGHTDSRGEDAMNLVLSQNRANAVQAYLIGKGISVARIIKAVGFGETSPISANDSEEGMQENRRSEIVVVER